MLDRLNLRIGASLLALGGTVLLWSSLRPSPDYYKRVYEVVAEREALAGKRLQVNGCVARGSVRRQTGTSRYLFDLQSPPEMWPARLTAEYTGELPDRFRDGIQVVANGKLAPDGRLLVAPGGIWLRCPGKYNGEWPADCLPEGS